jgi:hypothetical protein
MLYWISVKLWALSRRRQGSRLAAVGVMLLLWVAMAALEVSPALHCLLHKDAPSPSHNCLVTQFQNHALLSGFVAAAVPVAPDAPRAALSRSHSQSPASPDYRLPPGRAPPAA